jgi:Tol biopolymer transport system component
VSVGSGGTDAHGASEGPSISGDGRWVAFQSQADNLVLGDTNLSDDVFVRDCVLATTERVSVATNGTQADSDSIAPSISVDGRFIVFASQASNLVAGDTNGSDDIFIHDRVLGTTELVSVDSSGVQGNASSRYPSISADGRFVAFQSLATNLVAVDVNGYVDVFLRDRLIGTTELISVSQTGTQGSGASFDASISADGRYVAFVSKAWGLTAVSTPGIREVLVRDRQSGLIVRASVSSGGVTGNDDCYAPSISADGRYVAFVSNATNLVPGVVWHPNGFIRDLQGLSTAAVNVSSSGAPGNGRCERVDISSDGRFVTLQSSATNLIQSDTNGADDVFVRNLADGTIARVSVGPGGAQANWDSEWPVISRDGRYVAFRSVASNLVSGDTNTIKDVFLHDRGPQTPWPYCTSSTSSNGCSASIGADSHPSVSLANPCIITVTGVEGLKSGILFYGVDNSGFLPAPWGSGSTSWLCVKPPAQRTPVQNSGGTFGYCDGGYMLDWNAYRAAHPLALGNPPSVGSRVYLQAWFRDLYAVKATNLSNAIELWYVP